MDNCFSFIKRELLTQLQAIESLSCQREATHLATYAKEVWEKLESDKFNLVVLGEFKRGKTSFINALLGTELLPTAVVPLTSIVTVIEYGKDLKAEVLFLNGGKKVIEISEIASYVTEECNPNNEKGIKLVRLEYPSQYLKEGIILIDTPGVGSIYQNNTDETYNYLPKVDAAIFLLSSDQPLSRSECGFLKKIEQYSAKTFFILNKIDYLEETDRKKALEFAKKALESKAGFKNVNIVPLSAKNALAGKLKNNKKLLIESNLLGFTRLLDQFLLTEKGQALLNAACSKGINAANELQMGIDLETKALMLPHDELQTKIRIFDKMVENLAQEQEDNKYILKGEMSKVYHVLEAELSRFQENQNIALEKKVKELYLEKKNLSSRELLKFLENFVDCSVKDALDNFKPTVEEKVRVAFEKVVARFTVKTNKVVEELLRQSAEIFEIAVDGFTKMESLTTESKLYYLFGEEASMLLPDTVKIGALFLPKFMAGPMILKEMKKKVERELDRNCGRLRTDFNERIYESAKDFQKIFEEKFSSAVEGTRSVLSRTISKRQENKHELENTLTVISRQKEEIKNIKEHLKAIMERTKINPA